MSSSTPLYRTTKTRTSRTQEQLRSSSLQHKFSLLSRTSDSSTHQSYDTELPRTSKNILSPILRGLTGRSEEIDSVRRNLFTVGMWSDMTDTVYRCCFIQPEIASTTCTFNMKWYESIQVVIKQISSELPGSVPCTLSKPQGKPQISGRMTPYVVDRIPMLSVSWGFANISGSYLMFLKTDATEGQSVLVPSKAALDVLRQHVPKQSICVFDIKTGSYKITVSPSSERDSDRANKNTCMILKGDGLMRLQGKPSDMERVCESLREALHEVMSSPSSSSFLSALIPIQGGSQ